MCIRLILCAGALLIIAAILVAVAVAVGVFQSPEVVSASHHWGEVNEQSTTVISDVVVNNPNPAGFAVGDASVLVEIRLNGVLVGEGKSEGIDLKEGESENRIVTTFEHDKIPDWWSTHIQNGEHTEWTFTVKLATSVFGRTVSVPVSEDSDEFSTHIIERINSYDPEPLGFGNFSVDVTNANFRWTNVNVDSSTLEGVVSLHNQTPVSVEVAKADFALLLNDVQVGQGESAPNIQIEADAVTEIPLSFTVDHQKMKEWWPTHVRNSERSQVDLEIALTIAGELPEPVGRLELRLPVITITDTLQTNVLEKADGE